MAWRTRAWRRRLAGLVGWAGLGVLGCGTTPADLSCRSSRDCLDSEICHPDTSVCVELCTTKNDCPGTEEERVCEALSATDSTRICKCRVAVCLPPNN